MKRQLLPIVICLLALITSFQVHSQWTTITNGPLWQDTDGNPVEAHGAGFLKYNGKWYMAGEDRSDYNQGVNLYSSTDLQTWTFENKIIPPEIYDSARFIERAKLMRCPATGKFVVWCHYEGENYLASEAAVFYSDTIDSEYTFHWGGRPLGIKVRDCNVFVDNDDTAYFIATTSENTDLGLFRLSEDYLSVEEHTLLFDDQYREAPAIIRIEDTYFMISSALTGWDSNQAKYSYSDSLTGGWSSLTNLGNKNSFDTQAASILTIAGSVDTTYLYVGDRWIDPGLSESKTIIFPITFDGTSVNFDYRRQFDINYSTGEIRATTRTDFISKSNWSVVSSSSEETSAENGAASNAIDGNPNTKWHSQYSGSTYSFPHEIVVDMGSSYTVSGFLCEPRRDNDLTGIVRDYQLYFSADGVNWGQPVAGGWMLYDSEIRFDEVSARYFKLLILSEYGGFDYASISEIQVLKDQVNEDSEFIPWMQIDDLEWDSLNTVANVDIGGSVRFGPQTILGGGSWTWYGPNGYISTQREILLDSIDASSEGVYVAIHSDPYGNTSNLEMTLDVNGVYTGTYDYEIVNRNSGKCLRTLNSSSGDGASIVQYDCDGDTSSVWKIVDAGSGSYHLVHKASGKYADIANASTTAGANNIIWPNNSGDNQRWELEPDSSYFHIVNVKSGLLLDINSASTANNASSIQWTDNGGQNQDWSIVRINSSSARSAAIEVKDTESPVDPSFNIFPNPISESLVFSVPDEYVGDGILSIYDVSGKIVLESKIMETVSKIEFSQMKPGIYYLTIANRESKITKRVIKE